MNEPTSELNSGLCAQSIEHLCQAVKEFDPSTVAGSWAPDNGGEILSSLNKLSDALAKKAAEIKHYVRVLTVEELNELDGFDRCDERAPMSTGEALKP
ncbi:MAG TPA: hypothetical protein V6C81_16870 [Planktothrix sp.]|jgi:hypothetical protein